MRLPKQRQPYCSRRRWDFFSSYGSRTPPLASLGGGSYIDVYRARLCEQIPPIFSSQVGGPSDLRLSASSSFSAHFQTPFERFSFWGRVAMAASPAITAALLVNRYSDDAEAHFYLTPTCRALAASNFHAPYRLPPRATPAPFRPQLATLCTTSTRGSGETGSPHTQSSGRRRSTFRRSTNA